MTRRPDPPSSRHDRNVDPRLAAFCLIAAGAACRGMMAEPDVLARKEPQPSKHVTESDDASTDDDAATAAESAPDRYLLDTEGVQLEIDPALGARITRFGRREQNLLAGPDIDASSWGSTFWPSPQRSWSGPAMPELDSEPYDVSHDADGVTFTSQRAERASVSVKKRVSVTRGAVAIEYTLVNHDTAPASWAPWEVTRVLSGGLTFFPTGETQVTTELPVDQREDATWYQHDPQRLAGKTLKFSADGRGGWLAHVAGRTLLLKRFDDVPVTQQAPAPEAEIALSASESFVELEAQGAYTALLPGDALVWTVRWSTHEIPEDIAIEAGSGALFELAQRIAAADATE